VDPKLLFVGFLAVALVVYWPALDGSFISDDEHYVQRNVFVHELTAENVLAILDPTSVVAVIVENYAPVHILLHGLEWQLFGPNVTGYHVVNVILHALASVLLVTLFRRTGIPATAAMLGGAVFLVHPGNVEAVAWINQLKTSSAMVLCLSALLLHPRRPGWGALLFALALMAKPTAAVALFFAIAQGWTHSKDESQPDWRWPWLAGWAVILALFAVAEFFAFGQTAGQAPPLYADLGDRVRGIFAVAMRYLVMASTSYGLSAFHEPGASGWLDPWWLASLPVLAVLAGRTFVTLRDRRSEAGWWIFAVVSFAPICGVISLPFPLADRYLYFILPGLIGGLLLGGSAWLAPRTFADSDAFRRGLGIAVALLLAVFAVRSFDRSTIWQSPFLVMADAVRHYPEGVAAKTQAATRAAEVGDAGVAVELLEAAHRRGYNRLDHLLMPGYAAIQGDPAFVRLKQRWAREWIERLSRSDSPSQHELQLIAQAQLVLEDLQAARDTILRGIERGGPITQNLEVDLAEVERAIRFSRLR
jgi:hypothetical protein